MSFALLLSLACLCQGCIVIPVPASDKVATCGTRISPKETRLIEIGHTTRAEVVNRFGQPFAAQKLPAAIAYNWSVATWKYLAVVGYGPGLACNYDTLSERGEVLMFQFDGDDCVQRFQFRRLSDGEWVAEVLRQWTETKTKQPKKL